MLELGRGRIGAIVGLAAVTLAMGLGGSGRLTYHEAIWAQSAREMIASGGGMVPTLDGRPWLEKPPGGTWLIALAGKLAGRVDETAARAPSAVAGLMLAMAVASLTARRFGPDVGGLAGLIQVTTLWVAMRARLAEPDILLAGLVAWGMVAFDRVREGGPGATRWRWAFFGLLGATALFKGVGFGAALILAAAAATLAWDRDRATLGRLGAIGGWLLAGAVALAWPAWVVGRHPEALGLWTSHVAGRFAVKPGTFCGESWWDYGLSPLWQVAPWTPLAMIGARHSWSRAARERFGPDRLLWAWALAPSVLVSLASVRNAHYLIHALPPCSAWAALGLARVGDRLRSRGWPSWRLRRASAVAFASLGLGIGLGFSRLGPRFDRRGPEWAFYESAGRLLPPGEPLVVLYDFSSDAPQDRLPYPSPFGPMPHDLPVRLFYLGRPASWCDGVKNLPPLPPAPFSVLGRPHDLPALRLLGRVEEVSRGPSLRPDRTFRLFRLVPGPDRVAASGID